MMQINQRLNRLSSIEDALKEEFINDETPDADLIMSIYNSVKKSNCSLIINKQSGLMDEPDQIRPISIQLTLTIATWICIVYCGETQSLGCHIRYIF